MMLLFSVEAFPQPNTNRVLATDSITLYFRFGQAVVDGTYMNNRYSLQKLDEQLRGRKTDSISIVASSSPDGSYNYNMLLTRQRGAAIENYIREKYPQIDKSRIALQLVDENWPGLRDMVEKDLRCPYKERILSTIQSDINPGTKEWRLKRIGGGVAWTYIERNYLRHLRLGVIVRFSLQNSVLNTGSGAKQDSANHHTDTMVNNNSQANNNNQDNNQNNNLQNLRDQQSDSSATPEYIRKPLFALKTNLLFDLATALNVELEIPIGERWSVAGEWIFPWWLWEKKQYCLQMLNGNIEGRYWFGNRTVRPSLTGWFAGLYAGGGYYDLELGDRGYQGEFFIATGISSGYAHTINRSGTLRMEYSLGVGYMQTKYREYNPRWGTDNEWHLIHRQDGKYTWIGPTRARISLVWMLNQKVKKGGLK